MHVFFSSGRAPGVNGCPRRLSGTAPVSLWNPSMSPIRQVGINDISFPFSLGPFGAMTRKIGCGRRLPSRKCHILFSHLKKNFSRVY